MVCLLLGCFGASSRSNLEVEVASTDLGPCTSLYRQARSCRPPITSVHLATRADQECNVHCCPSSQPRELTSQQNNPRTVTQRARIWGPTDKYSKQRGTEVLGCAVFLKPPSYAPLRLALRARYVAGSLLNSSIAGRIAAMWFSRCQCGLQWRRCCDAGVESRSRRSARKTQETEGGLQGTRASISASAAAATSCIPSHLYLYCCRDFVVACVVSAPLRCFQTGCAALGGGGERSKGCRVHVTETVLLYPVHPSSLPLYALVRLYPVRR